jgi:hypothetical protein
MTPRYHRLVKLNPAGGGRPRSSSSGHPTLRIVRNQGLPGHRVTTLGQVAPPDISADDGAHGALKNGLIERVSGQVEPSGIDCSGRVRQAFGPYAE